MATTFAYSLGFSESGSIIGFIVALALTILTTGFLWNTSRILNFDIESENDFDLVRIGSVILLLIVFIFDLFTSFNGSKKWLLGEVDSTMSNFAAIVLTISASSGAILGSYIYNAPKVEDQAKDPNQQDVLRKK